MACCCKNVLHLCKVPVCGSSLIDTGIIADATGEHKLVIDFLDAEFTIKANITSGQPIKFPSGGLNENYTFTGQVFKPNGDLISFTVEGDETVFDCVSFSTGFSHQLNGSD